MPTDGNIKNMHYDFRVKLNRIDSAAYRDLKVPEVDRKINEAINLYTLLVAFPRIRNQFGFETTGRTTDDIRALVSSNQGLTVATTNSNSVVYTLPDEYLYYLSAKVYASRDDCKNQRMDVTVIKHDDRSRTREFYKSDFDWREINITFTDAGIEVFHNGDFTVDSLIVDYIKTHPYVHYAEAFDAGSYSLPDGTLLEDYQDCILPDITHAEIVDLAVLLATTDMEMPMANQLRAGQLRLKQFA